MSIFKGYGPEVVQALEEQGLLVKGQNETNSTLRQSEVDLRWTTRVGGVVQVPYAFAGQHDASDVAVIEKALKALGDRSRVLKFVPRSSEGDYIIVENGSGCSSYVGKIGGPQPVTLSSFGCVTHGIVQHEFLHALGFYHEQSRPDRDEYVKINEENIDPTMMDNFYKMTASDSLGSPYDYDSVLHYAKDDFSINGKDTITAPQAIGQRIEANDEDIRQVILLYQCVSGARSATEYNASPCNEDCKCWEGASGCNGNNDACLAGLECNANDECAESGVVAPVDSEAPVVSPVDSEAPVIFPVDSPAPVVSEAPVVSPVDSEAPVLSPVDSPAPVHTPVDFPVDPTAPIDSPVDSPAPVDFPVDSPAPVDSPVDSPAPVDSPVDSPAPVATPIATPVVAPYGGDPVFRWPLAVPFDAPIVAPHHGDPVFTWPTHDPPTAPFVMPIVAPAEVISPVGEESPVGGWPVGEESPVGGWPFGGDPVGGWPVGGAPDGGWPMGGAPLLSPTAEYE